MIQRTIVEMQVMFPIHNVRVVDGDTITANIVLPFEAKTYERIRLKGWWADEPVGLYRDSGITAQMRLDTFCRDKALWIEARGHRRDKYGRVVAHLWWDKRIISPVEVLGECQLTEEVHKQHMDANRKASKHAPAPFANRDGATLPDGSLMGPITHPEALPPWP